jgi:hypothetical protein
MSFHAAAQPSGSFTAFVNWGTWVLQRDAELGEDGAAQHGADEHADDRPPVEDAEDALVQLREGRRPALRLQEAQHAASYSVCMWTVTLFGDDFTWRRGEDTARRYQPAPGTSSRTTGAR